MTTQAEAAELFEISQPAVSKALKDITKSPQCGKEVIVPAHIAANKNSKTDFLKLSPTGQEQVRLGEPLNRVALAKGVRKRLSPLEQAQKAFRRLTKEDRDAFDLWRDKQSQ